MRFDRNSIMAPIGRPSSVMGVRPILREPGLGMPERSIFEQPNPFLPPQTPITPLVIPPKPPLIGGVGGINQDFRPLEDRGFGPGIRRSEDFFRPEKLMMPSVPPSAPAPILPDPRTIKPRGLPIGGNVLGGGGIDYGPVELESIETPIAPPPINIGGPALDTSLIPQREILERPIIHTRS